MLTGEERYYIVLNRISLYGDSLFSDTGALMNIGDTHRKALAFQNGSMMLIKLPY